jgi:hypothetical protein
MAKGFSTFPQEDLRYLYTMAQTNKTPLDYQMGIYLLANTILDTVYEDDVIDCVAFRYDPDQTYSAHFMFSDIEVPDEPRRILQLNFANIRTARDLVFVILHEWRHAKQLQEIGFDNMYEASKNTDHMNSPIELDADEFAFQREKLIDYKNEIINHNAPFSIFVETKALHAKLQANQGTAT